MKLSTSQQQIADYLDSISSFKTLRPPAKGWVRAIRNGLAMSRRQLAKRLNLSTSRIQRIEEDEISGAVTIKTMRRTAEAMDCVFVYALIPQDSLTNTIKQQASKKAQQHLRETSHSMSLEDQAVNETSSKYMLESLTEDLLTKSRRTLWDD